MFSIYQVDYDGVWLGGYAIVIAKNAAHAKRLVKAHKMTENFKKPHAKKICALNGEQKPQVVYNFDGDY